MALVEPVTAYVMEMASRASISVKDLFLKLFTRVGHAAICFVWSVVSLIMMWPDNWNHASGNMQNMCRMCTRCLRCESWNQLYNVISLAWRWKGPPTIHTSWSFHIKIQTFARFLGGKSSRHGNMWCHPPTRGGKREGKKKKKKGPHLSPAPISGATYCHENYNLIVLHFSMLGTLFDFLILINK